MTPAAKRTTATRATVAREPGATTPEQPRARGRCGTVVIDGGPDTQQPRDTMPTLEPLLNVALAYIAAGALFAVAFVLRGVRAVDPAARGTGVAFKLLILPGVAALWPLMAWRWIAARRRSPGTPHDVPTGGDRAADPAAVDWCEAETTP